MKTRNSLLLIGVFAAVVGTPVVDLPKLTNAQQQGQTQTTQLICCNLLINVPGTWIGASRECENYMNHASPEVRSGVCRQLREGGVVCPQIASYCSDTTKSPDPKCQKPTPWFDTSSAECTDAQKPQIGENQSAGTVTLSLCGQPIFSYTHVNLKDRLFLDAYKAALRNLVQGQMGSRVCCEKFTEAMRTGSPCDPRVDVDCDGKPNSADFDLSLGFGENVFPDINLFSSADGAKVDQFPLGLDPDDKNFLPPADKCDCKWQLVNGTLNCSSDGKRPHFYQARWKCPSTGNERFTRKEAPATAPCK